MKPLAQYRGKTDPGSVKGAFASLEDRVASVERKLAFFGASRRLVSQWDCYVVGRKR